MSSTQSDKGVDSIDFDDEEQANASPTSATARGPLALVSPSLSESLWDPIEEAEAPPPVTNPFLVELSREFVLARYRNVVSAFVNDLRETGHLTEVCSIPSLPLAHDNRVDLIRGMCRVLTETGAVQ